MTYNPDSLVVPVIDDEAILFDTHIESISIDYTNYVDFCILEKDVNFSYSTSFPITFDINKIDSNGNEKPFSGYLCNNEKIKLTNTSVHQLQLVLVAFHGIYLECR